jgi:hypothetical protein
MLLAKNLAENALVGVEKCRYPFIRFFSSRSCLVPFQFAQPWHGVEAGHIKWVIV